MIFIVFYDAKIGGYKLKTIKMALTAKDVNMLIIKKLQKLILNNEWYYLNKHQYSRRKVSNARLLSSNKQGLTCNKRFFNRFFCTDTEDIETAVIAAICEMEN